jgi:hypothetical protein
MMKKKSWTHEGPKVFRDRERKIAHIQEKE